MRRNKKTLFILLLLLPVVFIFGQPPSENQDVGTISLNILRGCLGTIILLGIAWLCSANRKAINWSLVGKGIALQLFLAILILKVPYIDSGFEWIGRVFTKITGFSESGATFIFGDLGIPAGSLGFVFAFQILPTILLFSALTSLFYYFGILQLVVKGFAWVMQRLMKLSGAESLAAAGNIFLGQTESPLLVRPYLDRMTKSEIMCLMTGGMATIAGGVLAAYISFLGGESEAEKIFFAKHLLSASLLSAPAAVVAAKMLVPETEEINKDLNVSKEKIGKNALEAITIGTTDGIRLAVNVGAMLLVFTALMAFANYILGDFIGEKTGLNEVIANNTVYDKFSFQFILGYLFAPIAWAVGISSDDMILVGQLLGEKTILNEFFAYDTLGKLKTSGAFSDRRSIVMATYMLCGFANFASIGIQIGGIGALVPSRKGLLSKLGIRALIGGTLACLFTAAMVGMFV